MNLSQDDIELFYELWYELIWSVNQKHGIAPKFDKPVYGQKADQQVFFEIRNELWKNPEWIDEFLDDESNSGLSELKRGILSR